MRLLVGRIGKAHGILGEATIEVRTDDAATRFAIGAVVETDSGKTLTVDSVRVHNGILLLGFEGISSRNDIEALRDTLRHDLLRGTPRYGRAAAGLHNTHYMTCLHTKNW